MTDLLQTGKRAVGARACSSEMTVVHNTIIRGANAIYLQAVNVEKLGTPKDQSDFVYFALRWAERLHEHHNTEETMLFPAINEITKMPTLMDGNLEEHLAFQTGLEDFTGYLESVHEQITVYDGTKTRALMNNFMPALHGHLWNEIDTLNALEKWDEMVDWPVWFRDRVSARVSGLMKESRFRVSHGR